MQNKTNCSLQKLPLNGTCNFRTPVWDFLLNGTCTFWTRDWDFKTSFFSFKNAWHLNDTVWYLKNLKVALKKFWTMADTNKNKTLVFSAAMRGFQVNWDVWNPLENEELECLFERHNLFHMFAIKTCCLEGRQIVDHLPRKISRPTKFLLDRGAKVTAQLTGTSYRRSPLFRLKTRPERRRKRQLRRLRKLKNLKGTKIS